MQGDAALRIPRIVVNHDVFELFFPGQHGRQHDSVVIYPGLGVENCDVVAGFVGFEQMFEHASGRHAVPDHHELLVH